MALCCDSSIETEGLQGRETKGGMGVREGRREVEGERGTKRGREGGRLPVRGRERWR